ncbi:endothelin-converting enzyme homolog [Phlebotomus argentipes]|uniref:endothelin-converting enzyme homolog n=1 Tax=Phlebotomus argentipes TaxID=94469 RepID=UPI0028932504|nr:endothelin-converting enzyme homolog [Phlebotomus argentipes]
MSVKMTRYRAAEFVDEDTSSMGSIHMAAGSNNSPSSIHIRYHAARQSVWSVLWRSRSQLERWLLLSGSAMLIAFLTILVCITRRDASPRVLHVEPPSGPCLSANCIHAASAILRAMDLAADPCDDFYGYACAQWIRRNPIPDGKSIWGTFGVLEQQNQLVLKNALERPEDQLASKAERKAKLYYKSCLDEDETMEKRGAEPLQRLIRLVGGWNVTASGWNASMWTLQRSLQILQNRYNMGGLFGWAVGEDDRNSSRHIIQIDQGGLALPTRDNYLNRTTHERVLTAYLDYMVRVAVLLGGDEIDAKLQMSQVIEFETRLAEITVPQEDRRDEETIYHQMTLAELQARAPFLDWRSHFEDALRLVKRKVTEKEHVVVYAPEYLEKLSHLVSNYSATLKGKVILNNYLVWQTVRSFTSCLSKAFRDAYKGLRKALIGSEGGEEPWRYCITDTTNVIGFAMGAMFVREVFHGEAKPQAEQMIETVRKAFKNNFGRLGWMDERTRVLARAKADAITDMIGFPDYILDPDALDTKYRDLDIDGSKYFENNLRVNMYNLKRNLEKLDQPVNKTRWGMTPSTVNAYYTPTKNQIVFPAGILQPPFFDVNNPRSLNYGAMGVVMGHELTHAFDDQGREYDKDGNLHQWWANETIERFKERAECMRRQYASYRVSGRALNGRQTLGENIADNGGLRAAYHAFMSQPEERLALPGLNLTQRQLFFVAFAQVWCSAVTDETVHLQIEKDPHSPPRFRVIGPLANMPEFAAEFSCPLGSPMNPAHKCQVW